jgi:hypothetical protein
MSKVSEAKKAQNYMKPSERPTCAGCRHFTSDEVKANWGNHTVEKNLRCSVGGFKVIKTAGCNSYENC